MKEPERGDIVIMFDERNKSKHHSTNIFTVYDVIRLTKGSIESIKLDDKQYYWTISYQDFLKDYVILDEIGKALYL